MLRKWSEVTVEDGSAAVVTAQLAANTQIIDGAVIPSTIMSPVLAERDEQIRSLLDAVTPENVERVAAELKNIILTVHVPKQVQNDVNALLAGMTKPVLVRLSPSNVVADPLAPTMLIGISEGKFFLDAMRMLYAELYTAKNLDASDEHGGAIIVQRMPPVTATYRIIRSGAATIVEATRGIGCWVGFGEPDRFLFENNSFAHAENGDSKGVAWEGNAPKQFARLPLGGDDAQKLIEWAKPYLDSAPSTSPLLCCATENGFLCLGAGPAVPSAKNN